MKEDRIGIIIAWAAMAVCFSVAVAGIISVERKLSQMAPVVHGNGRGEPGGGVDR